MKSSLANKQLIVGITGGIAAYKSAELVRLLQKAGASVRVIMTRAATEFITPLTLQALSGKPVHLELLDATEEAGMSHIALARWADAILVAPASANFLARLSQGRADDLLTTVCLASSAPIAVAPAMNEKMWNNPASQENFDALKKRGCYFFGPAEGEQACGDVGPGRMIEADQLCEQMAKLFQCGTLAGKRLVITAGPTQEALDPVRYLTNHSSGKMGYAIAQAAVEAGAQVTLISGPSVLPPPSQLTFIGVISAAEMHQEALTSARNCDIFIAAAAVADYRPANVAKQKIKKESSDTLSLELVKNPDIVADVAKQYPEAFVVGFAAETNQVDKYAKEKLKRKGLNMIIANDVSNNDIGFNSDDNAATAYWQDGKQSFSIMRKQILAKQLVELIASHAL